VQSSVSSRYRFVRMNLEDKQQLFSLFQSERFDYVINLAAQAGVRYSIENPDVYVQSNIIGFHYVLEACRYFPPRHLMHASSSSVYGANAKIPFVEDDKADSPMSLYAATKKGNELMAHAYSHLYEIPVTCLRFFTVYGPRQRPEMAIHKFTRLIYEQKPIPFFGDGQTIRDYTYIDDIIQGLVAAIDRPFGFEVFNLGESFCVSLSELVEAIEKASGRKALIQSLPKQAGDVEITYADVSKARQMLGYHPHTSIEEGLAKFIEWFEREAYRSR
jgi:UDP-glucuronate 4-epimerase